MNFTQSSQDSGRPEDLSAEGRDEEESAHPSSEALLQRIEHRDVALLPHPVGEEDTAWRTRRKLPN